MRNPPLFELRSHRTHFKSALIRGNPWPPLQLILFDQRKSALICGPGFCLPSPSCVNCLFVRTEITPHAPPPHLQQNHLLPRPRRHHQRNHRRHRQRCQLLAPRRRRRGRRHPPSRRPLDPRRVQNHSHKDRSPRSRPSRNHQRRTPSRKIHHPHRRPHLPQRQKRRTRSSGQRTSRIHPPGRRSRPPVTFSPRHFHRGLRIPHRRSRPNRGLYSNRGPRHNHPPESHPLRPLRRR